MQMTKHASEGYILALKPRADICRSSKQEYHCLLQKFKEKNLNRNVLTSFRMTSLLACTGGFLPTFFKYDCKKSKKFNTFLIKLSKLQYFNDSP